MTKEEFANSVISMEKSLYGLSFSILHSNEDCADAVQNAILKAFQNLGSLKHEKYFKTWLTRILINECFKIKNSKRNEVEFENYMSPVAGSETDYIFDTLMELEEDYRLPVILHYIEGYSVNEIHEMLGISESNVKVRLHRARHMLKKMLKGD